jgi:hypothetical protein
MRRFGTGRALPRSRACGARCWSEIISVRPFSDKQIELVSIFADQAPIAIERGHLTAGSPSIFGQTFCASIF